ncbi:HD domain-containing phosphohydrolase [Planococcus lenghuensis]|uniref:HD domain-containing phosphohydrolase n=1 Tax=Planococcus lenghuensis TaxID=2213202 RepID=UPI001E3A13BB|nr:HD domain-containing phosphohydrolase [Planococcus lenghuensis]
MTKLTSAEGKQLALFPGDDLDSVEFYYIISGVIQGVVDGETIELNAGDFFSAQGLSEIVQFQVKTEVSVLVVTSTPLFHLVSKEMAELRKVGEQVEQKDRYTFNHSTRVANYAVKTATKMQHNKEKIRNLMIAAVLHDIGKINVPEEVLNKVGKLTDEEFDGLKKHPVDGADMVRKTAYAHIAPIIEQHHERVNGSGYPFRLKGEEILTEAKIIGVCDTFDAMTEDRAYRKAFSVMTAVDEIQRLSGIMYDPEVVAAFMEVLKEEGKLTQQE